MTTVDEYFSEGADEFGAKEYEVPPGETDPRRLLVILLDTSFSMGPPPGAPAHREAQARTVAVDSPDPERQRTSRAAHD